MGCEVGNGGWFIGYCGDDDSMVEHCVCLSCCEIGLQFLVKGISIICIFVDF